MSSMDNVMTVSQSVCVSFTEIVDHVERAFFSLGRPTDSLVVFNQKDCCSAAELKVVSILLSGPSPSFFQPAVFQYLSPGKAIIS